MKYYYLSNSPMRYSKRVISQPMDVDSLEFDDLYREISEDWPQKAKNLQIRRWRKIRGQEF